MPPRDLRRSGATDIVMTITVDGVPYRFDLSNITAKMELDLYQQSGGLRLTKVMEELQDGATGFHIAAMVYLARRSEGDDITFDEVAEHMGIASEVDVHVEGEDDDDDTPEADRPEAIAAN